MEIGKPERIVKVEPHPIPFPLTPVAPVEPHPEPEPVLVPR